ncbi:rhomboid family intramembrane serine protease [Allosphingosinicella flava]|uniref:Rhomboid family intramembrane serine protease n=1 Tax=Allosphingosinicella flava TaxID=2771430 RepID=A0A7T2GKX3_9SPHN|nr:rhomboid family intramembrane serine protease [Sphingosinicella flava]QPQ55746.1 rhomboid family intramembrane serine protease [Sphingosinicella flava]
MRPPQNWRTARVTLAIAAVTALAWLLTTTLRADDYMAVWAGFIPARITYGDEGGMAPVWLTPLTATLVHGGIFHLAFNMLILLFCGRSVEPILGPGSVITLYIAGAYAAAAAQYAAGPSEIAPMIGASGAISALLGAYALLFGRNRVKVANPVAAQWLHALWLGATWIGLQLLTSITFDTVGQQVAIAAHIGGFLAGLVLMKPLLLYRYRKA